MMYSPPAAHVPVLVARFENFQSILGFTQQESGTHARPIDM
jgi:hypothetical protein